MMAVTGKMIASEILVCGIKAGIKSIPIVGEVAVNVVDNLQKRHDGMLHSARLTEFESQLSRVERNMRDTVEKEIRTILSNLSRPAVPGAELTREMTELRQIYEQGWVPSLFEGIVRNSSHWEELRRNPKQNGRILGDHEPLNPENGMHLLLDKDKTRILELPASSLAFLLGNQSVGVPQAEMRSAQDIWALPVMTNISGAASSISHDDNISHNFPPSKTRIFKGLALCLIGEKWDSGIYRRCEVEMVADGLTLNIRDDKRYNFSREDLHFAKIACITGNGHVGNNPAEFKNYLSIDRNDKIFHLFFKDSDWWSANESLTLLRKNMLQ